MFLQKPKFPSFFGLLLLKIMQSRQNRSVVFFFLLVAMVKKLTIKKTLIPTMKRSNVVPQIFHKAVHSHSSSNSTLTYCEHYSEAHTDALKLHHLSDSSYYVMALQRTLVWKGQISIYLGWVIQIAAKKVYATDSTEFNEHPVIASCRYMASDLAN
jgi:hypothetical protein